MFEVYRIVWMVLFYFVSTALILQLSTIKNNGAKVLMVGVIAIVVIVSILLGMATLNG